MKITSQSIFTLPVSTKPSGECSYQLFTVISLYFPVDTKALALNCCHVFVYIFSVPSYCSQWLRDVQLHISLHKHYKVVTPMICQYGTQHRLFRERALVLHTKVTCLYFQISFSKPCKCLLNICWFGRLSSKLNVNSFFPSLFFFLIHVLWIHPYW